MGPERFPMALGDPSSAAVSALLTISLLKSALTPATAFSRSRTRSTPSALDVVLRYPISQACVAPYLVIGGGVQTNGQSDAIYRLGGGLDVRFQPNGMGIFADGIYNWVVGQDNFTIARLGVRIPF